VVFERGHEDECKLNGPYKEACIFIANQEQVFEAGFSNGI
jgi:hypothetical protein